jgi:cell division protein FtsN
VADLNWAEENIQGTEESILADEEEEEAAPFLDENYDVTDFVAEDSTTVPMETTPVVVPEEEKTKEKVISKEPVIETKPVKAAEKVEVVPPVNTLKEEYLVWGGSFSTRLGAEEEQAKFKKLGYNKAEISLFDKGKYAVVIVGRYPTQAQAQALVNELKSKHNISAIAKKKKL